MRCCLPWFSEFLCYIKAKEGAGARQHCPLTGSLRGNLQSVSVRVKWKVRWFLQFVLEQRFWFKWNLWMCRLISLCVHSWVGMRICVCICWRIREWDPRIHSLECEVCALSSLRARNVSQTHCTNFKWQDVVCVMSDRGDACILMQGAPQALLVPIPHVHLCICCPSFPSSVWQWRVCLTGFISEEVNAVGRNASLFRRCLDKL